jgi:hypothetical protein
MKIKLPKKIQDQLSNLPENGMGYQRVNLVLANGKIIKNAIINNGEFLETNEDIDITKLKKIIVQKKS